MTRTYCDRCRELIEGEAVSLKPVRGKPRRLGPIDLCRGCWDSLIEWIDPLFGAGPAPDAAPPDAAPPAPKPKRKGGTPPGGRRPRPSP